MAVYEAMIDNVRICDSKPKSGLRIVIIKAYNVKIVRDLFNFILNLTVINKPNKVTNRKILN